MILVKSEMKEKILSIVRAADEEYFDGLLAEDESSEVFIALTRMRSSLLNWYEFREDARVLEIGDDYGAVTGTLCDNCKSVVCMCLDSVSEEIIRMRYRHRENLKIYPAMKNIPEKNAKFDYIVLNGMLEKEKDGVRLLESLKAFLKEDGIFLIATDNRYGIRYFCGEPDEYNGIPFCGINGYPLGSKAHLYSRAELLELIEKAGFGKCKLYYPLPDYRLTQAVYTDEYMPKESIKDRVIPYYTDATNLVAAEDRVYDDLIQNHVLHFFSNSFLAECSVKGKTGDAVFAALSTDRKKSNAFATIIRSGGIVRKKALYVEGRETLHAMADHLGALKARGIQVIDFQVDGTAMEMPFVEGKNLAEYMAEICAVNKALFIAIIEQLYQSILKSAAFANPADSAVKTGNIPPEEVGPILEHAYIDMIPYNCFYVDGNLVFYDQEFVKKNFPAKYVLFRAIRYLYIYIRDLENIIPISFFKEKYLLKRLWNIFEQEEAKFVEDNRNYEVLGHFYKLTNVDYSAIDCKFGAPNQKEVYESGQKAFDCETDIRLQGVKSVQMDLLRYFDSICQKEGLRYCAIYGTLLGTIRHRGYIPWDDDIDLAMPREDYERLKEIAGECMKAPYFLQYPENDKECFYGGYGKLRNSMTSGLESFNRGHHCNQGIWIDIFPLDFCYKDAKKRYEQLQQINMLQMTLMAKVYSDKAYKFRKLTREQKERYMLLAENESHESLCKKLQKAFTMCDCEEKAEIAILSRIFSVGKTPIFSKKDFQYSVRMKFEDMTIPVPVGYKHWLETNVGKDYKLYPPKGQRHPHHSVEYDVVTPYTEKI